MGTSFPILPVILPVMHEGVVALDKEGVIQMCNDAAARLIRLEEVAKGRRLVGWEFASVCRLEALTSLVEEALFDGEAFRGEVNNEGGNVQRVEVSVIPKMRKGKVIGAVLLLLDRTDVFRLERVRQDFVANVSHELRTPIAAIRGWSETLATGPFELSDFVREQLQTIMRHADRLTALVNDLLTLSKAETVGTEEAKRRIDVQALIDEIVASQHEAVTRKELSVEIVVEPEVSRIYTHPRALEYVLRNLVENAIKYTPSGGEIEIRAELRKKGRFRLSVQDTGIGIEQQHLPRLFERFYRVDAGRSRSEGGTGLGLAIVKHYVSALGGDVKVYSEPGKGSQFAIRLPREAWVLPEEI